MEKQQLEHIKINKHIIDKRTGELLVCQISTNIDLEKFIYMHLTVNIPDSKKLNKTQIKVLTCCWMYSVILSYGEPGNKIRNDLDFKEQVRKTGYDLSNSVIDAAICTLAKKGLLTRICQGLYQLNKEYFPIGMLSKESKMTMCLIVESNNDD